MVAKHSPEMELLLISLCLRIWFITVVRVFLRVCLPHFKKFSVIACIVNVLTLMLMIGHSIRSFKVSRGDDKQQATWAEKVARGLTVTGFIQDNRLLFHGAEQRRKLMWKIEFWLRAATDFPEMSEESFLSGSTGWFVTEFTVHLRLCNRPY